VKKIKPIETVMIPRDKWYFIKPSTPIVVNFEDGTSQTTYFWDTDTTNNDNHKIVFINDISRDSIEKIEACDFEYPESNKISLAKIASIEEITKYEF